MSTRRRAKSAPAAADAPVEAAAAPVEPSLPAVVALGSGLSIRDVAARAEGLGRALAAGRLVVDAAELHQVDSAGLQLLVSARRTALARGVPFAWHAASDDLTRAARRAGLADALALPTSH